MSPFMPKAKFPYVPITPFPEFQMLGELNEPLAA